MGHPTEVFGYILGIDEFARENGERIAALPEEDSGPSLTRDMFAVPRIEHSYLGHLIPFGLVYKNVEIFWEAWLTKFEALLRTMYWDEAHVYLHTDCWGSFHYKWVPTDDEWPHKTWEFSGGPRSGIRDEYREPHDDF